MKNQDDLVSSRVHLGFTAAVLSSFNFLVKYYNFMCVNASVTFVRYESTSIFVNIYHGRKSYELGVEIGKIEKDPSVPENWYTIGEIMDFFGVRQEQKYTFFQSSDKDTIKRLLEKLSRYVKDYAEPILNGNSEILKNVQVLREKKSDKFIQEMNLRHIREEAEAAWRQKDYLTFVKVYSSVEDGLTLIEAKKLEYARRRLTVE